MHGPLPASVIPLPTSAVIFTDDFRLRELRDINRRYRSGLTKEIAPCSGYGIRHTSMSSSVFWHCGYNAAPDAMQCSHQPSIPHRSSATPILRSSCAAKILRLAGVFSANRELRISEACPKACGQQSHRAAQATPTPKAQTLVPPNLGVSGCRRSCEEKTTRRSCSTPRFSETFTTWTFR